MPLLKEAEDAAKGIKPPDISELRSYGNPKDIQKYVFDMVLIVFQKGIDPVTMRPDVEINKQQFMFLADSYNNFGKLLPTPDFCKNLLDFTKDEKDMINDETVELLEPYLTLEHPKFTELDKDGRPSVFQFAVAKKTSGALGGLCVWCKAMSMYQKATKVVKPKMEALNRAKAALDEANEKLAAAEN